MLKKAKAEAQRESAAGTTDDTHGKAVADAVLESSRQIWLAGLGAFARAKGEGARMFEALVAQGQSLESRTRHAAAETATAARVAAQAKAKEMQAKAGGTWDKLEQVFEDRVARALARLGVQTQGDVERLVQRVDALSEAVNTLIKSGSPARPAPRKPAAAKRAPAGKAASGSAAAGSVPAGSTPGKTTSGRGASFPGSSPARKTRPAPAKTARRARNAAGRVE